MARIMGIPWEVSSPDGRAMILFPSLAIRLVPLEERAEHDIGIDETEGPMAEGAGQRADDGEAESLPQFDRGLVGRHHEVELHGPIAEAPRLLQAMLAHGPADAEAAGRGTDHEGGVGHV